MTPNLDPLTRLQADLRNEYAFDLRFANASVIKGSGSPERIGDRLFCDGVKYGSVLRDIEPALPLFDGSCLAFSLALKARARTAPATTVYDKLYDRFTLHFGQFASSELVGRREQPADTTAFRVGLSALAMTFTSRAFDDARRNPQGFETPDFANYLLTFLSLAAAARCWGVEVEPIVDERILSLPLPKSFERLRQPAVALIVGAAADPGALEEFRRAYGAVIHAGAYELGLIGNMRFSEAFAWSLLKERGRITSAVVNLLES